jgi:hypothetical protein
MTHEVIEGCENVAPCFVKVLVEIKTEAGKHFGKAIL